MSIQEFLFGTALIKILQDLFAPQLNRLFIAITELGSDTFLVGIAALIYWCFDKRQGRLLTYVLFLGAYLNFFLKIIIPSPRPPLELRITEQNETSFGFPSGHVQDSTTFWTWTWLSSRKRIVAAIGTLLILAVGISRIYLGLHYPFQVIGGVLVGLIFVGLVSLVVKRIPYNQGKIRIGPQILFSALAVSPLAVAVFLFGVAGDAGRVAGYLLGFSVGAILEDRYIGFKTDISYKRKIIRIIVAGIVGGPVFGILSYTLPNTSLASTFVNSLVSGITVVLIVPFTFKLIERN